MTRTRAPAAAGAARPDHDPGRGISETGRLPATVPASRPAGLGATVTSRSEAAVTVGAGTDSDFGRPFSDSGPGPGIVTVNFKLNFNLKLA